MRFFFLTNQTLQQLVLKGSLPFLPCVRCPQTSDAKGIQPTETIRSVPKPSANSGGAPIQSPKLYYLLSRLLLL